MSQNRPAETIDRIITELEGDGPYASTALAAEMRRANDRPGT
jgi:transcriptional regulator